MHHAARRAAVLLSFAIHLLAPAARAQSAADRETARSLVIAGRAKLEARDFEGALKDLKAAHAIMGVPTTGLDLAKAQLALGLLVEARDTALAAARLPASPGESPAFGKARIAAARLAEEIAPRIPSITIKVLGPAPGSAGVTLDGVEIKPEALGVPWKTNPGEHALVARAAGFTTHEGKVRVDEGEGRVVSVTLEPAPGAASSERPQPSPAPAPPPSDTGAPAWAWGLGGVGIAAGVAAAVFAIDYSAAQSTIGDDCPDGVCDPTKYTLDEVQSLDARRRRSGILAIGLGAAGAVALGIGAYGILSHQSPSRPEARRALWVSVAASELSAPTMVCGGRF